MEADKIGQILELMAEMNNKMDTGFNKVYEEFDKVRSEMADEFSKVRSEMADEFGKVRSEMTDEFGKVYDEFGNVYSEIKSVRMTLENETNKNIKIIAEGHMDLSNKLDNALKIENEKELFKIRLNILENQVQQIRARIN